MHKLCLFLNSALVRSGERTPEDVRAHRLAVFIFLVSVNPDNTLSELSEMKGHPRWQRQERVILATPAHIHGGIFFL